MLFYLEEIKNKINSCNSSNYTKGRTQAVGPRVIHYSGNDGDIANGNCTIFQGKNRNVSAHYCVNESEIVKSVKDSDTEWHSGNCTMNCRSIGIEMCSKRKTEYFIFLQKLRKELFSW